MWHYRLVTSIGVWLAGTLPAGAFIAYVSNEKSNTVSVIDTDKWAVVQTIKVGQRPRGIEFTRDGKFVLVAVGDDDTIQMIDTATQQVADTLPSGPDPELFVQDKAGKVLWENKVPGACGVARLPNGHTLVATANLVVEVSRDGKRVWERRSGGYVRRVHRR